MTGNAPGKRTTAGDAILAAGYPLEVQTVTTSDGYIMHMERIPRPGKYSYVPGAGAGGIALLIHPISSYV